MAIKRRPRGQLGDTLRNEDPDRQGDLRCTTSIPSGGCAFEVDRDCAA